MPENTEVNRNLNEIRVELGQVARIASGAVQNIATQSKVNEAIVARLLSLEQQIKRIEMSLPRL